MECKWLDLSVCSAGGLIQPQTMYEIRGVSTRTESSGVD